MRLIKIFAFFLVLLSSACAAAPATPNPDGPLLTGFDALPKSLATVYLSPVPDVLPATPTLDALLPSATAAPATFTPTPTPLVGIFMGEVTYPALDGTFSWMPTHSPRIVILTAKPGFHPTAAPIVANFSTSVSLPPSGSGPFPAPITPGGSAPHPCSIPVAGQFTNAYTRSAAAASRLGCPTAPGYALTLVSESFQSGIMFWRETKDIYALSTAAISKGAAVDTFWRVTDSWTAALPASDPALQPPAGLAQPVRGFGYAWRSNAQIRGSLGWALSGEQQYGGFWQDFEHGFMLTGNNSMVYALAPGDGPPVSTGQHFGALPQ